MDINSQSGFRYSSNFVFYSVTPYTKCRLKQLKLERIKDYLLMEEEFIKNQERLKPQEEKHEVIKIHVPRSE